MNMSGLNVMSRGPELAATKVSQKKQDKPSSPFASMLNKEVQHQPHDSSKKQVEVSKLEDQQTFAPFTGELDSAEVSIEDLEKSIGLLMESTEIPTELTEEMLTSEDLSWLQMLPPDLVQKIQELFESGTSLEQLFNGEESASLQVEQLFAGLIFVQKSVSEQLDLPTKDVFATILQQINSLLHKVTQDEQVSKQIFNNQGNLKEELQQFLSSIHTKLTGKNPLATDENHKMDYLRLLYQRTIKSDELVKNNSQQDSNNKVAFVGVESQTNLNRAGQFALFVDQTGNKAANQEQFIKEFQSILAKSNLQNATGGMKLLIKLYPEHLGQLRVELLQQNGVLTARMVATTAAAKEMLESQLQGLKNAFAAQNVQVEKLEIVNSQSLQQEFDRSLNKDGNQEGRQSSNDKDDKKDEQHKDVTFEAALNEELMNIEV
ncbi:flagellar hook-length control protein FliK [Bacillus sp. AK128]